MSPKYQSSGGNFWINKCKTEEEIFESLSKVFKKVKFITDNDIRAMMKIDLNVSKFSEK